MEKEIFQESTPQEKLQIISCEIKKPDIRCPGIMRSAPCSASYGIFKFQVSMFSSLIQTVLSVPEFSFSSAKKSPVQPPKWRVADYTAGWDLHPTPKIFYFFQNLI